ncbi:MAG: hypothetical protein HQM14_14975 [SAR324 cluster bacterium]|nr:hypothetical protein [SAR324 cluster bacterium]
MDKMQQQRYITDICEELKITLRGLARSLRVSEEKIILWSEGKKILEYQDIKALEALLDEARLEALDEFDLQTKMDRFRGSSRLSEYQLAQVMGLSSVNQLYEIYRKKTTHHIRHLALLQREQLHSGKQGVLFVQHMEAVNYQFVHPK